jgi:hypothetical protein
MFSAQRVAEFSAYVDALDDDSVAPKMKLEQIRDNILEEQKRIAMIKAQAQMTQQRARQFLMSDPNTQADMVTDAQMQLMMQQPIEGEQEVIEAENALPEVPV